MRDRAVMALLRSPLHRMLSRSTLIVEVGASESGAVALALPVRYVVVQPGQVAVVVTDAESVGWWRRFRTPADVTLQVAGRQVAGRARLAEGEELDEAMIAYLQRFPGAWRRLGIDATADGDAVGAAAGTATVVLIDTDQGPP